VLFAVQTVSPVIAFEEQAFTAFGVAISVAAAAPSTFTTPIPVVAIPQAPFGTYAVTVEPKARAKELEGMQAAMVFVLPVTAIELQSLLEKAGLVPVTQTAYVRFESEPGIPNVTRYMLPRMCCSDLAASVTRGGDCKQVFPNETTTSPVVTPAGKPLPVR
jgi:hypothetical protein